MDIAIIGAGIAGLSAGWALRHAGHRVRMFERNYKPGGRMNTRRKAGLVVDHGDRFIYRDSPVLRELITDCGLQGEVATIDLPIYTMREDGSFQESAEEGIDRNRITFPDGMLVLPEALRRQLGGYYSIGVTAVERNENAKRFVVQTEPPLRPVESHVDAVVIAVPATEAVHISRPIHNLLNPVFLEKAREVEYTRCLTLMAALPKVELPQPFYGLTPPKTPTTTLSWVAFEDLKCARRGVHGWSIMIAHSTSEAGAKYLSMEDENALGKMYQEARRYVPQLPSEWRWARAKRWRVAHLQDPTKVVLSKEYPAAPEPVLVEFCGDYREGDGCESAARSGRLAAESLQAKIEKLLGGKPTTS